MWGAEPPRLHAELPLKAPAAPFDPHNPPRHVQSGESIYRFGPFELDSSRHVLKRGAKSVALSIRPLDVVLIPVAAAAYDEFRYNPPTS